MADGGGLSDEKKDDGGPAFPWGEHGTHLGGQTMRDYFAGQALAGFCANPAVFATNERSGWDLVNCTDEQLAQCCIRLADAMLAGLSK